MNNKSSNFSFGLHPVFFTVLILILPMLRQFSFSCKLNEKQSDGSGRITMNEKDTTIEIRGKYMLSIPVGFKINSGAGDDTEFMQLFSDDGEIVLGYEHGAGSDTEIDMKLLENKYKKIEKIKKLQASDMIMAYSSVTAKLRDLKGEVLIEQNGKTTAILNFSCSSGKLEYLTAILLTMKSSD